MALSLHWPVEYTVAIPFYSSVYVFVPIVYYYVCVYVCSSDITYKIAILALNLFVAAGVPATNTHGTRCTASCRFNGTIVNVHRTPYILMYRSSFRLVRWPRIRENKRKKGVVGACEHDVARLIFVVARFPFSCLFLSVNLFFFIVWIMTYGWVNEWTNKSQCFAQESCLNPADSIWYISYTHHLLLILFGSPYHHKLRRSSKVRSSIFFSSYLAPAKAVWFDRQLRYPARKWKKKEKTKISTSAMNALC